MYDVVVPFSAGSDRSNLVSTAWPSASDTFVRRGEMGAALDCPKSQYYSRSAVRFLRQYADITCTICLYFLRSKQKISVCRLWMHIRSLWMAIRRLCTAIRNLQTEISACCQDNSSTLHRASQRAASAYAAHCVARCSAPRLSCDHGARRRVGWRGKLGSAESFQSQGVPANGLRCGGVGPRRFHCTPERTVPMGCYARKAYATALSGS